VLGTPDSGNRGGDIAVVLKEVEVTPRHLLEVMGFTQLATLGVGKHRPAVGFDSKAQFMRYFARNQHLFNNLPRRLKT